jgi:hypothetical protein
MTTSHPVTDYGIHVGFFHQQWANPPAAFNPYFDPKAKARYAAVTASMEADGFYGTHTREECKAEWARRYISLVIAVISLIWIL